MNKILTPKFIVFIGFFAILLVIYGLSSYYCDNKFNDFFIKVHTKVLNKTAPNNVVLVVVDDKSLNKISWPWKRSLFSNIFDFLEFYGNAKSIVYQNLVLYPDTYNIESDLYFYQNLLKHKALINSYIFLNSNIAGDVLPDSYIKLFNEKLNLTIVDKTTKKSSSYKGIVNLPKQFIENTKVLASSQIPEDFDTIVRSYMPVVRFQDKLYPSLALSAYAMYTGIDSYILYDDYLCSNDNCKKLKMPVVTAQGKDYIGNNVNRVLTYYRWYKPTENYYSHKTYSAIDILDSYNLIQNGKKSKINPEEFKNKIVIIGLNADNNVWEQLSETPVLKKQADIDVHAVIIDNMLANNFTKVKLNHYTFLITFVFCLFIIFGFKSCRRNLVFATILSLVYFSYYMFEYLMHNYIPPITPIITLYTCTVLKKIYTIVTTDKTSEMIKHAMGKYISKDVMKRVLLNLDKLKLGGIRTVVTILFVDIRNFTQISESLTPSDVTSILNEYFSVIEPVIGKYHGVINKYMGDGVLAIFGEPIKNDNHAMNAISCGAEILDKIKILREKLIQEGKPKIYAGIGINTGEVFVGNIGTEERFEYTVIGDNVNLAYRIESFNRILKTQFLISEYTYDYVKDNVDVVKLSQVEIKGKSKPIDIYEILSVKKNNE